MFWIATLMAMVLPWWQRRQKQLVAVQIIEDRCTGCTKCAQDCPYHAIEMIKREDEKAKHPYLAVLTPSRCVGCGICIGACDDFYAIAWGDGTMPQALSQEIELAMARGRQRMGDRPIKLILTCERHAEQGAKQYLAHAPQGVELIVLPCVGAIQPSLLPYGLSLGASEVEVVGCPTFDCANREGNIWQEQRLIHERVPRLRAKYDDQPITAAWLSPDQFSQALPATLLPIVDADGETSQLDYLSTRVMNAWFSWRNWVAGIALLAAVLLLQIALTGLPFRPYASDTALVQVAFEAPAFYLMQHKVFAYAGRNHYSFHWEVDGESIYVYSYHRADSLLNSAEPIFASHYLPSGQHHLRLFLWDADAKWQGVFYEETIMLKEGQILRLNDVKAREKVRLIYAGWQ